MFLLEIFCVLLLGLAGFLGFKLFKARKELNMTKNTVEEYSNALEEGQKAVELALKYEEFYSLTVGDIGEIVDTLGSLVKKRQVLSDDADVQNLVRLLAIAHDTLLGYINAKSPTEQFQDEQLNRDTTNKQKQY